MSGTVDDFIQRFGGQQTVEDHHAAGHFFDRFASTHPDDKHFDNEAMSSGTTEYLGKLPEHEFQQAAQNAYASANPQQQQGLVGTLMRALQNRGVSPGGLGGIFGGGAVPQQMNAAQYAQAVNYVRQRHPDAMQEVVREQPWFVKAMGNPVVMGALGMVASRMIKSRMAPPPQRRGGLFG